jgi:hypothetical protein
VRGTTLAPVRAYERLLEIDHVDVALDLASAWKKIRLGNLGRAPLIRALFALRTLPDQVFGEDLELRLEVDDIVSTPEHPGFRILVDNAERELVVGAIGKVWRRDDWHDDIEGLGGMAAMSALALTPNTRALGHAADDARVGAGPASKRKDCSTRARAMWVFRELHWHGS